MSWQVRRLTSEADMRAVAPVWSELSEQHGHAAPFATYDWFECCRIAAPTPDVEVLQLEDAGVPVCLIPLQRRTMRHRGLPTRYLSLLDCPDSPFGDLVPAGGGQPLVATVLDHLTARSDWDILELGRLPAESPTLKVFEGELEGRLRYRRAGSEMSPYLAIDGSWQAFYGSRSPRFKKTIRNIQNRLARLGTITVEEHRTLDPQGRLLEEMIDLTGRSWKADRGVAIATMPRMREFFSELSRRAAEHGWLSLWLLRLDGRPIAMEYQLRANGVAYALRADYDLAHAAASPGSSLNFEIARALFERGEVREYHMGPGLNDYKMRWASGTHETVRLHVYRPGFYPALLHLVETRMVPAARRFRERAR
jgi:CelD/BcsL family acetyltransferase involved in cellulose biosynthesis